MQYLGQVQHWGTCCTIRCKAAILSMRQWLHNSASLCETVLSGSQAGCLTDDCFGMQLTAYSAINADGSTSTDLPPGIQFTVHSAPAPGPGGQARPFQSLHLQYTQAF